MVAILITPGEWTCIAGAVGFVCLCWVWRDRVRRKIKRLLGLRVVSTLLVPLAAAIPLLVLAITDEKKNYWPAPLWKSVRDFLDYYPWLTTAALLWPIIVIVAAYAGGWLRKRFIDLDEITAKEYGLILRALDEVAGHKMGRFGSLAADTVSPTASVNPSAIFQTITQPVAQVAALLNGIFLVFRLDAEAANPENPDTISVTLARLERGQFTSFEAWVPQHQPPNSTSQHLRRRDSAVERAAAQRKMLIIKDIKRELKKGTGKRFCPGAPGSSEDGSMIAFPIIHQATKDVPYVVCVRSQQSGHFSPRFKDRYATLLQPFAIRISIEHSLAILKDYHAAHDI